MRGTKLRDRKQCPECHDNESIVEIAYGYPGEEMIEKYVRVRSNWWMLVSEDN